MEQVSSLVTQKLEAMVEAADRRVLNSKREAISALLIYVILEQGRQQQMANAISYALQAMSGRSCKRYCVDSYTPMLFCGPNTPPMDSLVILLSPYIRWNDTYHSKGDVIRWAAAALTVPYTEEVGRDVVGVLLQISMYDSLRPHIPIEIWMWLKKHSTLPPLYRGRTIQITGGAVSYIRGLGDIEISKSFFILAWSQFNYINDSEDSTKNLLREDFCGIGMWSHRKDLVEQLDRILESCDPLGRLVSHSYEQMRDVLWEVETEATKTLIRMLPKLSLSISMLTPVNGDAHRIAFHLHLCSASPLPMTSPLTLSMFGSNTMFLFCHPSLQVLPHLPSLKLLCSHILDLVRAIITVFVTTVATNCFLPLGHDAFVTRTHMFCLPICNTSHSSLL